MIAFIIGFVICFAVVGGLIFTDPDLKNKHKP